jgi:hypothetical protein
MTLFCPEPSKIWQNRRAQKSKEGVLTHDFYCKYDYNTVHLGSYHGRWHGVGLPGSAEPQLGECFPPMPAMREDFLVLK